jgi:hypothetical protein
VARLNFRAQPRNPNFAGALGGQRVPLEQVAVFGEAQGSEHGPHLQAKARLRFQQPRHLGSGLLVLSQGRMSRGRISRLVV